MDYSEHVIIALIQQFRIREGSRFASRQDALVKTALRWTNARRNDSFERSWTPCQLLEDAIDQFIDRNLYFLPLPRMLREAPNTDALCNIDLLAAFLLTCLEVQESVETFDSIFDAWQDSYETVQDVQRDETFVSTLYNAYQKVCPWLPLLRDTSINHERLAYLLCLLALDAHECRYISSTHVQHVAIEDLQASLEAEGIVAHNGLDALAKTDAKLFQKQWSISTNLLPKAETTWISCNSTEAQQFLQDPAIQKMDAFVKYWSSETDFSDAFLRSKIYVENFIDEEPKFGFIIE